MERKFEKVGRRKGIIDVKGKAGCLYKRSGVVVISKRYLKQAWYQKSAWFDFNS